MEGYHDSTVLALERRQGGKGEGLDEGVEVSRFGPVNDLSTGRHKGEATSAPRCTFLHPI